MKEIVYNFVIDCSAADLAAYKKLDIENPGVFNRGDMTWCLRTFLILSKRATVPVLCSNNLMDDAINIIHSDQLLQLKGKPSQFIVCAQADFPHRPWAHYHIVQNKNQLALHASYIPHWLQPGLIKRDASRRGVCRIGYAGQTWNGNLAGTEMDWKRLFEPYSIEFVTLSSANWHDLRDIDVLIGIRSFDLKPHNTKPPSKLFNAWYAGIPFVGGFDSAYRQVATPGEDYLLSHTPQEAVAAVIRLQSDPKLYATLVQNGQQKVLQYTHEHTANTWEQILTGPLMARFQKWQSRPQFEQQRFTALLHFAMLKHKPKQFVKKWIKKADSLRTYKIMNAFK